MFNLKTLFIMKQTIDINSIIKSLQKGGVRMNGSFIIKADKASTLEQALYENAMVLANADGTIVFEQRKQEVPWYQCETITRFLLNAGLDQYRIAGRRKNYYIDFYLSGPGIEGEVEAWMNQTLFFNIIEGELKNLTGESAIKVA